MSVSPAILKPHSGHSDWMTPEQLAQLTPGKLADRLWAIKDEIASYAEEAERLRHPHDNAIAAIRKTGVFYHFVPKKYGGLEYGLTDLVNEVLPIGEACTSTAWVTSFCIQHNFLTAQFPEAGQDEIFGATPYTIAPGTGAPPAKVTPVSGGYQIDGVIKYASGVMHADWVQVVGAIADGSGPPKMKFLMMPIDEVTVLDTWYVDGLAATGSNDIRLDNVFVPERRAVDFDDLLSGKGFGAQLYDNPLYRVPVDVLLNISSSAPGIGAANGLVKYFRQMTIDKATPGPDGKPLPKASWQKRLAEAELAAFTAETLLRQAAAQTEELTMSGHVFAAEERVKTRSRIAYAVSLARHSVRTIADGAGSSAHNLSSPIQRVMRDLNMMAHHRVYDQDSALETWGKVLTDGSSADALRHHSAGQVKPAAEDAVKSQGAV